MKIYSKLQNIFIAHRIEKESNPFEIVKIKLAFNFTFFMSLLAIPFIIQLLINNYTNHLYINIFEVASLLFIYYLFTTKIKIRYIGICFVIMDSIMSAGSLIFQNGFFEIQACLWSMLLILYTFFVIGKNWGIAIVIFIALLYIGCIPLGEKNVSLLNFGFPENQILPTASAFIVFPFLLNIYIVWSFISSRKSAEILIQEQKKKIEIQNEDIISSINYAKRIQYAVLPSNEIIVRSIPLSFIYYQPKDIVSGDFYWFYEIDRDNYILACADCTGHGVPGAMMTVIGSNALTQIVAENKIFQPSKILKELDFRITQTLKQQKIKEDFVHDGMDLALIKVNKERKEIIFTSAKRIALFVRENQLQEIKGSKNTLGGLRSDEKTFDEVKINYKDDDCLYLFTDGYIDQFGGSSNKKFMIKRFRELVSSINSKSITEQKKIIEQTMINWIGENEQTDDITVIGIRF